MVKTCLMVGCTARGGGEQRSFFRLPAVIANQCEKTKQLSEQRRRLWLTRISRADLDGVKLEYARVCGAHFVTGKPAALFDCDNPDWAPSLLLGHSKVKPASDLTASRKERVQQRAHKRKLYDAAESLISLSKSFKPNKDLEISGVEPLPDTDETLTAEPNSVACQTDISMSLIDDMQSELNRLTQENMELRIKVEESTVCQRTFENDDGKVKFYTGLPSFTLLMLLFNYISDELICGPSSCLNKFQQMVLTLMRLRLNLSVQDIAYHFNVSCPTVSRTFSHVINVMYHNIGFLVKWPSREALFESTPMEFRKQYGVRVSAIIDCFEVFTDRPTGLMAQAQTWSNYSQFYFGSMGWAYQ
ncbi:uncharacterized protein LOC118567034 [Fundulus heteroclitus]|uniref:uncharacterized protein LOC118567034 n=1 Tax=Fundulus heteroclitus TaxID=8078 RepID=UPI00165A99D3|nr:uncharacterized protein LOC118567034 [Fundulus heteroclitus]